MNKAAEKTIKNEALEALKARYKNCTACPLATQGRTQVVFGFGNCNAKLMLIGEAPGKDEDTHGLPFIGKAGKLLTSILTQAGWSREELYVSNVAKCRPPKNRPPTIKESSSCSNILLQKEIAIIKPNIICTLGNIATQALLGQSIKIGAVRGTFCNYQGHLVVPTYHPAYILRDPSKKSIVLDDLKKIEAKIKELNA